MDCERCQSTIAGYDMSEEVHDSITESHILIDCADPNLALFIKAGVGTILTAYKENKHVELAKYLQHWHEMRREEFI